ncbi:MAG: outer membrane beta-barrel protein [Spirosomataceae bacterium]
MINQEQNNFEEQWKQAFESASMPPSDKLWANIEAELDKDKRRLPVFFILRPSYLMGGVAALLLMLWGGISIMNNIGQDTKQQSGVAVVQPKKSDKSSANTADKAHTEATPVLPNELAHNEPKQVVTQSSDINLTNNKPTTALAVVSKNNQKLGKTGSSEVVEAFADEPVIAQNLTVESGVERNTIEANQLDNIDFQPYRSRFQARNLLQYDVAETEEKTIASNDSKFWLGVQSGVSPFNPNVNLNTVNASALSQAEIFANSNKVQINGMPSGSQDFQGIQSYGTPQNQIRSGLATNIGFATGYDLNKKWSVESGLRYMSGNSSLLSNTYSINEFTGQVNTYLAEVVSNRSSANTVIADVENFNNRYQYLMLPVQAAYKIPVSRNIDLSVLGGFSTDLFLQHNISTRGGLVAKSTISQGNTAYRSLNLSGLGGVRANYLFNKHWQANIGMSYQHSLLSGMKNTSNLNMQMRLVGLQYGLNYRF